jgi:alkylation response protein AidB-like acyl-CoA dehydrogenase
MDWNSVDDSSFRAHIAEFVRAHCPRELRFPKRRLRLAEVRDWYKALSNAEMLAPAWPARYGGMGLNPSKTLVYLEAMEASGAPRLPDQGIINLGPLLIKHGTEQQRAYYLPRILSAEHIWCQGYSEPNAGSDLASLRTTAALDGDEYVVNGQKIWTTWAYDATHIFALVRTDAGVAKQAGISFLMLDLAQPGITVRPIETLMGHAEFCEVFFDNARTSKSNLVGEPNQGWTVAKALLGFERIWAGSPRQAQQLLGQLRQYVMQAELQHSATVLDRLTQFEFDVADLQACYARFAGVVGRGEPLGADVSILKVWATETCQRIAEYFVEVAGDLATIQGDVAFAGGTVDVLTPYLDSRSFTIYGGSSEIQRNILAKSVLNLPV